MKVNHLDSFPPNSNPFCYDLHNMGINVGSNVMVMMSNHDNELCKYLIVVNKITGERIRINFDGADRRENHQP